MLLAACPPGRGRSSPEVTVDMGPFLFFLLSLMLNPRIVAATWNPEVNRHGLIQTFLNILDAGPYTVGNSWSPEVNIDMGSFAFIS